MCSQEYARGHDHGFVIVLLLLSLSPFFLLLLLCCCTLSGLLVAQEGFRLGHHLPLQPHDLV
jgi:hypothetical protein